MKKILLSSLLCFLLLLPGCRKTCQAHTDANADEICDRCGASVIVVLDIYAINDLHGKIMDGINHPGVDELTTYLVQARKSDETVLLLSTGDMWQGSAESNITRGVLMTDWMNQMDFAAMAVGNHEFDWGESFVEDNAGLADFPFLAINIYDRETNARVDYCQSSTMISCDGVQIGIIGAIGDCYSSIAPEQTENIYFITGTKLTTLVKEESEKLRAAGADFIIYTLHDGLGQSHSETVVTVRDQALDSYYDPSLSDGFVDLVFEGHSHQQYILQDSYGVYHLQNGGDNNGISHVEIAIHSINGCSSIRSADLIPTSAYEDLDDAPLIQKLLKKYDDEIAPVLRTVGTIGTSQPGENLRQLVANLYYLKGMERWGADYDISLGGGFISIRSPGYLIKGDVTYAQLMSIFPFDNELVLCTIRGSDLKSRFLETDNDNYFICCGTRGESFAQSIDPGKTYYIVTDTYTSTYAPNRLTEVERYGEDLFARDLLADYIASGGIS